MRQNPDEVELKGHVEKVLYSQISRDGTQVVSSSTDRTVKTWNVAERKELVSFDAKKESFSKCSFSVDNNYVFGVGDTIICWYSFMCSEFYRFQHKVVHKTKKGKLKTKDKTLESCYLTPDNKYLITGAMDTTIRISDITNGNPVRYLRGFTKTFVSNLIMDKAGKYLYAGSFNGQLAKWDFETGKMIWNRSIYKDFITSIDISSDAKYIFVGGKKDSKIISTETGKEIVTILHDRGRDINFAESGHFSSDGKYLYICYSPGLLEMREMENYSVVATLHDVSTFGLTQIDELYAFSLSNFSFNVYKIIL